MSSEVAVDYRECVYPVPYVSLRIDEVQPIEGGIKQLLKCIRPDWPTDHIQFKVLLLNLVNILLHIFTVCCKPDEYMAEILCFFHYQRLLNKVLHTRLIWYRYFLVTVVDYMNITNCSKSSIFVRSLLSASLNLYIFICFIVFYCICIFANKRIYYSLAFV